MIGDVDNLYAQYAKRFLLNGNPKLAAAEIGVPPDSINEFLNVAKTHPDVCRILAEDELSMPDFTNPDDVKKYILKQLMKEANFRGHGAQQSARISALKAIAELTGIEPPKKIDVNNGMSGGMLMVPMMDAAMWEESAARMQAELKDKARE